MKQYRSKLSVLLAVIIAAALVVQGGNWATATAAAPPTPAVASIPTAFSYQGTLRLANGTLPTGPYTITLNIYNAVTGGTPLHSETFANVPVRNGSFSVVVGDATPINPAVFDNANLYIGITVAPDPEMLPRQRLFPVPWAMQAGTAAKAITLVPNAVVNVNEVTIDKGSANEVALRVTSSGPGWGSGIRFDNTFNAANHRYGIYVDQLGNWNFGDDTAGANRLYITPDGVVHAQKFFAHTGLTVQGPTDLGYTLHTANDITTDTNIAALGNVTSYANTVSYGNMVASGKVYALSGFNGTCGPDPGAVGMTITCNRDVAETFATDQRTEPGDIVVFVPEDRAHPAVRLSSGSYASALVGVVSTSPGLVFDEGKTFLAGDNTNLITDKKTVVAMVGRVPVKYSLENGPIAVGDPLTSSSTPGTAMKATAAGQIIGYAMQGSESATDGKLLVWLQLGTYVPPAQLAALNSTATDTALDTAAILADLQAEVAELKAEVAALKGGK